MNPTDRRRRLRQQFASETCVQPASVFDAISGRLADALGYEVGILGGSVASTIVLGAPDVAVLTLSELRDQVRRITRVSDISLIVDADHGYGNALNVMRAVEELESAEISGLTIEDTNLPAQFGNADQETLITLDEMIGKLKAALAARKDPETMIIARTGALRALGMEEAIRRINAFESIGVDAVLPINVKTSEQIQMISTATNLPIMLGNTPADLTEKILASYGVHIVLRGHYTLLAAVKGIQDVLSNQIEGHGVERINNMLASANLMGVVNSTSNFRQWEEQFLN